MEELWKDIPGYEGIYQVSNFGKVRNNKLKVLTGSQRYGGYTYVFLTKNSISKSFTIHYLVMLTFVGEKENNDIQINHKDEDPSNNRLDNLEYVTCQENCNYGNRIQRINQTKSQNIDKKIYCSKDIEGENIIKIYNKAKQVQDDGFNYDAVLRASLGKYGKGTHKYKNVYWFRKEF